MSLASSIPSEILDSVSLERRGSRNFDRSETPSFVLRKTYTKPKRLQSARYDEHRGTWICRNCGWAYPSPNPKALERREHKRHCHEALKVQRWLGSAKFGQDDGEGAQQEGPGADFGEYHESPVKLSPVPSEFEQTGTDVAADENKAKPEETISSERLSSELELAGMDAEKQSTKAIETKPDSDDVRGGDTVNVQHQQELDRSGQKFRDHSTKTCEGNDNRKRKTSEGGAYTDLEKPEITEDNHEKEARLKTDDKILEEREAVEEVESPISRQEPGRRFHGGIVHARQNAETGQTSEGPMPPPMPHSSATRNWDNWEDVVKDEEMLTEGSRAPSRQENDTAARNWEGWEDLIQHEREICSEGSGTHLRGEDDTAARNWDGWEDVVGGNEKLIECGEVPSTSLRGADSSTGQPSTDQPCSGQPNNIENISIKQKNSEDVDQSTRDPTTTQREAKEVPCPAKLLLAARNWDDWEDVVMTGSMMNRQSVKLASLTGKDVAVT